MNSYHDLIDRIDGYTTGTLTVDNGVVALQTCDNALLTLSPADSIDVLNGRSYVAVTHDYAVSNASLVAGLYARINGGIPL